MLKVCYKCTKNFFKMSHSKTAEATGDLIGNKIADKFSESQKLHHRII